jgi:ankyrin repeat protein
MSHPLVEAAVNGNLTKVKEIIDKSPTCSINQLDKERETALMKSSKYGHAHIVSYLLDKGADIHLTNGTDETALILASQAGSDEIVKMLIAAHSNIHHRAHMGTPIIMAAQEGHTDIIKTLIEAGANVNDTHTDANDTPLHLVLKYVRDQDKLKKGVKLLINAGAKNDVENEEGETPLTLAHGLKDPVKTEIIKIIKKKKGGKTRRKRQKSSRKKQK